MSISHHVLTSAMVENLAKHIECKIICSHRLGILLNKMPHQAKLKQVLASEISCQDTCG